MPPSSPASVSPSVSRALLRLSAPGRWESRVSRAWGCGGRAGGRAGRGVTRPCGLVPLGGWAHGRRGLAARHPRELCQLCPPLALRWGEQQGAAGLPEVMRSVRNPSVFPFSPRCAVQRGAPLPRASLPSAVGLAGVGERFPPSSSGSEGCWGLTRGDLQCRDLMEKSQLLKSLENAALFVHGLLSAALGLSILQARRALDLEPSTRQ